MQAGDTWTDKLIGRWESYCQAMPFIIVRQTWKYELLGCKVCGGCCFVLASNDYPQEYRVNCFVDKLSIQIELVNEIVWMTYKGSRESSLVIEITAIL